jgi:hypothetical protein
VIISVKVMVKSSNKMLLALTEWLLKKAQRHSAYMQGYPYLVCHVQLSDLTLPLMQFLSQACQRLLQPLHGFLCLPLYFLPNIDHGSWW